MAINYKEKSFMEEAPGLPAKVPNCLVKSGFLNIEHQNLAVIPTYCFATGSIGPRLVRYFLNCSSKVALASPFRQCNPN